MSDDTARARALLEHTLLSVADREVAKARVCNSVVAICDVHGLEYALGVLDDARRDLMERRGPETEGGPA